MKARLEKRLEELKKEFASGQEMLVDLDKKRENLHMTLLRISGAIQIIEEQLGEKPSTDFQEVNPEVLAPEAELVGEAVGA